MSRPRSAPRFLGGWLQTGVVRAPPEPSFLPRGAWPRPGLPPATVPQGDAMGAAELGAGALCSLAV